MTVLLDSNILLRLAQATHPMHATAQRAVTSLQRNGQRLHIVSQNVYEFWVVATRPIAVNGLGLTATETDAELTRLQSLFPLLHDLAGIFAEWHRLVVTHNVLGKNAHDARLVAAMVVHGITQLLTFNTGHFSRYPGITALDPATVTAPPAASP
jgi:predicted nucleic acid-binding protein